MLRHVDPHIQRYALPANRAAASKMPVEQGLIDSEWL